MYGNTFPNDVTVLLIEAACVDFGTELSAPVGAAAQKAAARIAELLAPAWA
jgi:Ni,Fe-hydrogenase maturation factor